MDIRIGDRVKYKNRLEDEIITMIVLGEFDINKLKNGCREIIKIERPHYEVVEEKKELLTEEEREYLKKVIDTINEYSGKNIKYITLYKNTYYNEISFSDELFIVGKITVRKEFYNLKSNQTYTLKELGLEEE